MKKTNFIGPNCEVLSPFVSLEEFHARCVCLVDDSLGADAYWAAGLHVYTPLPFRPGRGGLGDRIKTHLFVNTGNLIAFDTSKTKRFNL